MNELIRHELNKFMKSRAKVSLVIMLFAISALLAFSVVAFESYYYIDDSGQESAMHGKQALIAKRNMYERFEGRISTELIEESLLVNNELNSKYGPLKDVPLDIYYSEIYPIEPIFKVSVKYNRVCTLPEPLRATA